MVAKISICMHAYYFPNSMFSMQVLHNITRVLYAPSIFAESPLRLP
jgi:hypothetical protein